MVYMCVCLLAQSCITLCDPIDCSLPSPSVHGILQANVLEWVATSFSREIFLTQGSNPGLHCRWILSPMSHWGSHKKIVVLLFSRQVISCSLRPYVLQHARPPCPSPSPGVCPSSCPLHRYATFCLSISW